MFETSQQLSPYQRCNDQRQQNPVFLRRSPVQDILRVVGRLRDQDGFAVGGEFDVFRACVRNDPEAAIARGIVRFFANLGHFDCLFQVGGFVLLNDARLSV